MIHLYEVQFDLDNGQTLHVLIGASTEAEAQRSAHEMLMAASEPRNIGDCIRYCWKFNEITVSRADLS